MENVRVWEEKGNPCPAPVSPAVATLFLWFQAGVLPTKQAVFPLCHCKCSSFPPMLTINFKYQCPLPPPLCVFPEMSALERRGRQ